MYFLTCLKVAKDPVVRPQERSAADNRRMGFPPKPLDERILDVKKNIQSSIDMRDNEIDMTDTDDDILPPPPPPLPFPIDNTEVNPVVPSIATTRGRPVWSENLNSVRVFTVASLQQCTNSFSQENFLGSGMLGSVYKAKLPDGKV